MKAKPVAHLLAIAFAAAVFGGATTVGCSDCDLDITTGSLPDAFVGVNYDAYIDSDCGGDFWFIQSGNLPPGIQLNSNGDLGGVPTLPGVYNFTVAVAEIDDFGYNYYDVAYRGLSIIVRR